MTGQVQGKIAMVTGGASGIGAAVAELLAREGASVAVTDIDDLGGLELVAKIKKAGQEAMFLHQDVTSEARWVEVVAEVEKRYGRLDILVSNAGIAIVVQSITDMLLQDWQRQGGVRLFAKAVAMECALVGDGIRVNSVHPGVIDTPIWSKAPTEASGSSTNAPLDPEQIAKAAVPLARAGHASEIASGVLYLASDASSYVTGSELVIDGGMFAGSAVRRV